MSELKQSPDYYRHDVPITDAIISDFVKTMMKSSTLFVISKQWTTLALSLDTSAVWIDQQSRHLFFGLRTLNLVLDEMLRRWKSNKGKDATVLSLIHIIEKTCEWKAVADDLKTCYLSHRCHFPTPKNLKWLFNGPPQEVIDFLSPSDTFHVLVVQSENPELECHRICDTIDGCKRFRSSESLKKRELCNGVNSKIVPVLKFSGIEYENVYKFAMSWYGKCRLVGSKNSNR